MDHKDFNHKRIAVVGVGGVGGYIAGMLTRRYANVTVCARGDRGESIRSKGLLLHSDYKGESLTHPANVVEAANLMGEQDIIFVCVKNYSLEEVGGLLDKIAREDTVIVPIMNGVDPGDRLRRYISKGLVLDSLIYIVAFANEDYSITQQGQYADVKIGIMNATEEQRRKIEEVAAIMAEAGIDVESCEDIEAEIWKKYILNCAYNVLTAVYNNTIGELRDDPTKRQEIIDLIDEAYLTAVKKGVHVKREHADAIIQRLLYEIGAEGTSSLQRDILAHKKAEIDTFGGYLVHEAERLGINVPLSQRMYQRLLELV